MPRYRSIVAELGLARPLSIPMSVALAGPPAEASSTCSFSRPYEPCGSPDKFIRLIVRTSDGKVLEALSEKQTKSKIRLASAIFLVWEMTSVSMDLGRRT